MSRIVRKICGAVLLANMSLSPISNAYACENTEVNATPYVDVVLDESIKTLKHGQVINVGDSNLRIRKGPSLEAEVEYGMYEGDTFDILGRVGDWYKIFHYRTEGYVHKDYVVEYDDVPPYETYDEKRSRENQSKARQVESSTEQSENTYSQPTEVVTTGPSGRQIKVELTAYCNCSVCTGQWGGLTAMGTTTRVGVVAVPQSIPLGSKLYIPGLTYYKSDGIFHAEDRGGAIVQKGDGTYIVDVWMPSHGQALEFGRQTMTAYIME